MNLYMPERVIFVPSSLKYPLGRDLYGFFQDKEVEVIKSTSNKVAQFIPGTTSGEKYASSKRTIVVTTAKSKKLDICKPSADYQFSLVSSCPGNCEYCYLQTTQGEKPYIKVFVNLEDIFNVIEEYIGQNPNEITTFEAASLGDPLALEHITGSLAKTIEFFGNLENGKLRVVTKYSNVDSLLSLKHNKNTQFRISINSNYVIDNFEHSTSRLDERIEAIIKLGNAGYPIGFLIAPIMIYDGWKDDYRILLTKLKERLGPELCQQELTFELIQHRFTAVAKELIVQRFPKTKLDMEEEKRTLKWGRFGRFKYIYPKEQVNEIREYLTSHIVERFPRAIIKYFT